MIDLSYALTTTWMFDVDAIKRPSGCVSLAEDDFNNSCTKTVEQVEQDENLKRNIQFLFNGLGYLLYFVSLQAALEFSINFGVFQNEKCNGKLKGL